MIRCSEKSKMKDTSTVTRQIGASRIMSLRYKITDLSQHPQSQTIFIKVILDSLQFWNMMINCDSKYTKTVIEPTKVQLNIISYATFFNTIFKKVLGDLCIQSLILPNPIFMVYFIYVHQPRIKYERFVIDFISMFGENLFHISSPE